MLLHHKLENAIAAWIQANKGERLAGVTVIAAHATVEPQLPALGVWCGKSEPHPDFPGFGRGYPRLAPVTFEFRICAEDAAADSEEAGLTIDAETGAVHAATIAAWTEELALLLAGDDLRYSALKSALNYPAAGPDTREVKGLHVTAIHPAEEGSSMSGNQWSEVVALEVVAQEGDCLS